MGHLKMPLSPEQIKKIYGEDYPAAATIDGIRIPLANERKFSRFYHTKDRNIGGLVVSRFMDGSASITAQQLEHEWGDLTDEERVDFCQECGWLHKQEDYPDMLRFVISRGSNRDWSAIASCVAQNLPQEEAFRFLLAAMEVGEPGHCGNLIQAIALTKHRDASVPLRKYLAILWNDKRLWDNDDFLNWIADNAESCITYLIDLGAAPAEFEEQVRRLSNHVCSRNRDACHRWLSKHYPWM